MKHLKPSSLADILAVAVPVALVLPCCYSCLLDTLSFAGIMAGVLLPLGVLMILAAISRNTPRTSVLMFPLMFIGAFQIVVSYLYHDGSPIGVDMFLNLRTTNMEEASELLESLIDPVVFVTILYLPLLIASTIAWIHHKLAAESIMRRARRIGIIIALTGATATAYSVLCEPSFRIMSNIFPLNALDNLVEAVNRQRLLSDFNTTTQTFSYDAITSRADKPEVYIAVIGETSRADNWELLGYDRHTNPRLSLYGDSLMAFRKVFSESNTTHKSVPMLLNTLSARSFKSGIYKHKSIIAAFNQAGFSTNFISVQKPNKSLIDRYAGEADKLKYLKGRGDLVALDQTVLPTVDSILADKSSRKKLIVIHTYGSHYNYSDRYPATFAAFRPDRHKQADYKYRRELMNAYDNTIVYTDYVLSELIARIKRADCDAALIYTSDHGEDIFDDERNNFLHASPVPTYWQLHVPLLIYMNGSYSSSHPEYVSTALANRSRQASSSKSFSQTLLQIAGIRTKYNDYTSSLVSEKFASPQKLYFLNDHNNDIDLSRWGFTGLDKSKLTKLRAEK